MQQPYRPFGTWIYNLALALISPLLLIWLAWRMLVRGKSRDGFNERVGHLPHDLIQVCSTGDPVVWFHAASVGEVAAAEPIIAAFAKRQPLAKIILSTVTPTGQSRAKRIADNVDSVFFFPFDVPFVIRHVFSVINPSLFVMVETELWPNALAEAHRRGIPVAMVNARLSGKSWKAGRFLRPFYRWMLESVTVICAQSDIDIERFVKLGAPAEHIVLAGNSKFDQNFPVGDAAQRDKWRADFGFELSDKLLLAGSTHPGEEEIILHVFQELRARHGDLQLIIAPRHPERGDAVEGQIRERGYQVTRRTVFLRDGVEAGSSSPAIVRVGLLDTIGELSALFGAADVVMMGGSFARIGGHDILQPIAQGKPVIFGPHMYKSMDIMELALRENVAFQVSNVEALTVKVDELLRNDAERQRLADECPKMILKYAGASERCAKNLDVLLSLSRKTGAMQT